MNRLEKLNWLLLIAGAIGLIAAIILTNEDFNLFKNPQYVPVCNLNPILNCGNVAKSTQNHAFGIPNPFLGIAGFAILATIGAAGVAGAKFKRWFWQAIEAGVIFAVIFIHWMVFQALYRLGELCIFCMVVWSVTIPIFWYVSLYNLDSGNIRLPARYKKTAGWLQRHHGDVLMLWFLIIFLLILKRFWYYWSTL